jgi:hypothetical protein
MRIQKAINDGQTKIAVISNDEDFSDIFGMISLLNPDINLEFKLIKTNVQMLNKENHNLSIVFV